MPYSEQNVIDTFHPDYNFAIAQFPEDLLVNSRHVWHGVAIGWNKNLSDSIIQVESTTDRIVGVKMLIAEGSLLLESFYAPTAGRDEEFPGGHLQSYRVHPEEYIQWRTSHHNPRKEDSTPGTVSVSNIISGSIRHQDPPFTIIIVCPIRLLICL